VTCRLVLRGGRLADGSAADVAVDARLGTITAVGPSLVAAPGDVVEPCAGMVILAAPAEPHAHLDKALSAERPGAPSNPVGDLAGAVAAWRAQWPLLTHDDIVDRATRAVDAMVLRGTTAIRTHVDVGHPLGLRAVRALVEVRAQVDKSGLADLQLVALIAPPLSGTGGAASLRLLDEALDLGVDVVGGCPYADPDPSAATAAALATAGRWGVPVDLHTDETLAEGVLTVAELARLVIERGPGAGVTASHCVSLGVQPPDRQAATAEALAAAGVGVVALPQTNLFLQARGRTTAAPRGLTALRPLLDAGVTVAAGADNVRDPFCSLGRFDATETAALMVLAGHLSVEEAWQACTTGSRLVMGLPPVAVAPGEPAELVAIEGETLSGAVAVGSERRVTVHRGRVVARSSVSRALIPAFEMMEV
jgi:cytosine deaminase